MFIAVGYLGEKDPLLKFGMHISSSQVTLKRNRSEFGTVPFILIQKQNVKPQLTLRIKMEKRNKMNQSSSLLWFFYILSFSFQIVLSSEPVAQH